MGTEFNEQIAYLNAIQDANSQTTFAATDTYYPLNINPVASIINTTTTTSLDLTNNHFQINSAGIYLVQYRMAFTGGSNDEYKIGFAINSGVVADDTYEILPYTEIVFSTKGASTWEVQNLALINLPVMPVDDKGFGSSKRNISMRIKNQSDTSSITLKNASFVIIRIQ